MSGAARAPLTTAVVANRLCDRRDMSLGERPAERRAPVAAGPEADELGRIPHIGLPLVVLPLESRQIDDHGRRRRLPGQRGNRGSLLPIVQLVDHRGLHHDTGHGLTCQISAAYSAIVRSLENFPELATFRIALRAHEFWSVYSAQSLPSASR